MLTGQKQNHKLNDIVRRNFLELTSFSASDLTKDLEHGCTRPMIVAKDVDSTSPTDEESTSALKVKPDTFCSNGGLACTHQLRACVNMIKVKPTVKKVIEMDTKMLQGKQKRKLYKKWVPCGTFDLQELIGVKKIISKDHCAKSIIPW